MHSEFSSVQMLSSVWLFATLWRLQNIRLPCPEPTTGIYPNSCSLIRWCHPTISSSVIPFSSGPQSFPESGSFLISQLFASGGQSTGDSASTSVLPMNTQVYKYLWEIEHKRRNHCIPCPSPHSLWGVAPRLQVTWPWGTYRWQCPPFHWAEWTHDQGLANHSGPSPCPLWW